MSKSEQTWIRLSKFLGGQVFIKLLYMAGIVLATRAMGVDGWGLFSASLSVGMILITLVNLGLNPYVTREVAAGKRSLKRLFAAAGRYRTGGSILFLLLVPPLLVLTIRQSSWFIAIAVASYIVVDSWAKYFFAQLRGAENTRYEVYGGTGEKALVFLVAAATFLVAPQNLAVPIVAMGFLLAAALKLAVAVYGERRALPAEAVGFRNFASGLVSLRVWKREAIYLRASSAFLFMALFSTLYFRLDSYMLATLTGNAAAGNYGAAYKVVEGLLFAPEAVLAVYSPLLVRALKDTARSGMMSDSAEVTRRVAVVQTMIVASLTGGILLEHEWIITTLYGFEFARAEALLLWLAPSFLFMGYNFLLGGLLTASYRQESLLWIAGVGALVNLGLNAYAIPKYGAMGAVVATAVTEGGVAVLMAVVNRAEVPFSWLLSPALRVGGLWCAIVMFPSVLFADSTTPVIRLVLESALTLLFIALILHLESVQSPFDKELEQ